MKQRRLFDRLPGAFARRMAKWFGRRKFTLRTGQHIITFTFDDFPHSALSTGGALLELSGARGTYFVSHGLMGQTIPTGRVFKPEDLPELLNHGHELGCHTFHHYPAWETAPAVYAASVARNASALEELLSGQKFQSHSYPISYPRPGTKRRMGRTFRACRGGGQTYNLGTVDLNYLSSYFLEQGRDDFSSVEEIITANAKAGGWLIFSTHDIGETPTRFGCTPAYFKHVVRSSVQSGAQVLTMSEALDALGVCPLP